jgi:K+/H+ antiporter YhaU regulatory subunit KhtT
MSSIFEKLRKQVEKEALERMTPILDEMKTMTNELKEINKKLDKIIKILELMKNGE